MADDLIRGMLKSDYSVGSPPRHLLNPTRCEDEDPLKYGIICRNGRCSLNRTTVLLIFHIWISTVKMWHGKLDGDIWLTISFYADVKIMCAICHINVGLSVTRELVADAS